MIKMWNQDLSLGIDISDQRISATLLSRHQDIISVVRTASQTLSASAFSGDSVKAAQAIGREIRQMLLGAGIRQQKAWICFGSKGLLLQMVDTPEQLPANLGQYLHRQIRNSPLLNSKNPYLDFAAMTKNDSQGSQQCLVAAIDSQRMETLIKSLGFASLDPMAVDIPVIAVCRALYKKQLSQGYKYHTLLFYLHGRDVYLAVFRKTNLDYVRLLGWTSENGQAAFEQWSIEQIRAVIQFYELEYVVSEEELLWQFILVSDNESMDTDKLKEHLNTSFSGTVLCLDDENVPACLPIENNTKIHALPLAATGAALRKWNSPGFTAQINLLPEQNRKMIMVTEYLKNTTKIVIAAMVLLLILAYGLSARVGTICGSINKNGRAVTQETVDQLLTEQENLEDQLNIMTKQKQQIEAIIEGYPLQCIAGLMDQIRQRTPSAVCMTQLWSSSDGFVEIKGYCRTMEDIQRYAHLLETADLIRAAQVRQSGIYPANPDMRCFTIVCTLREGYKS